MFDVYFFSFANKEYCYDIQSNTVMKSSQLFYEVLKHSNMNSKMLIKQLYPQFPVKDITDMIVRVQELEKRKMLVRKASQGLIYDHSNLISLECIYYSELTAEVEKSYKSILERLQLKEEIAKLVKLDNFCMGLETQVNIRQENPFDIIEEFLRNWTSSCRLNLNKETCDLILKSIEEAGEKIFLINEYLKDEDVGIRFKEIISMIKLIYKKKKKFTHCSAGIKFLVINAQGMIYNCNGYLKTNKVKSLDDIGYIVSLMDIKGCRECFGRFVCGGGCSVYGSSSQACKSMRRIIEFILLCSTYIAETDNDMILRLIDNN